MARIKYENVMTARFLDGTFDRVEKVLQAGEERTAFVRVAVEREIERREKASKRKR